MASSHSEIVPLANCKITPQKSRKSWPRKATLYQHIKELQLLLPEAASCQAVKTYLTMCKLPFAVVQCTNAERISERGRLSKLPVLMLRRLRLSEFEPIVEFVEKNYVRLQHWLPEDKLADVEHLLSYVDSTFSLAEFFISFKDKSVYEEYTTQRIAYPYDSPNDVVQTEQKYQSVIDVLRAYKWQDLSLGEVVFCVNKCCESLTKQLLDEEAPFLMGARPTALDALVFGHIYEILTTPLPNSILADTVLEHTLLVKFVKHINRKFMKLPMQ